MAKRLGFGNYQYELVENWPKIEIKGAIADAAVDAQGRVYAGVRNPKPDGSVGTSRSGTGHVVVLDRDGNEVGNWGNIFTAPHGVWVNQEGEIYLVDAGGHTVTKHAPTGEVLLTLGTRGQPGARAHRSTCRPTRSRRRTAISSFPMVTARTGSTASRQGVSTSSPLAKVQPSSTSRTLARPTPARAVSTFPTTWWSTVTRG